MASHTAAMPTMAPAPAAMTLPMKSLVTEAFEKLVVLIVVMVVLLSF